MKSSFVAAAAAVGVMVATLPSLTDAKSFDVNITGDAPDTSPGDGFCGTVAGFGKCTLRAAIEEANSFPGADVVTVPVGRFTLDTGALDVTDDLIITGAGANSSKIDARRKSGIFHIIAPANVTISQVTIQNAFARDVNGGGLVNDGGTVTLTDVVLSKNISSGAGGGLLNQGTASLTDVTFTRNKAGDGGGLTNFSGLLTLTNVTFSWNKARNGGGGIENPGGTLTLSNVTFIGNKAPYGAALINNGGGAVTLTNVTFAENSVTGKHNIGYTAGSLANFYGTITITNSIVSGGSSCESALPINSGGHNIDNANTCGFDAPGDLSNTDPLLLKLSNNGGSTETVPLRSDSPAIDAGDETACPAIDQRGITRPQGAGCDIGAYEVAP